LEELMFWFVAAGMTGLAALAVLWPLSVRRARSGGNAGEAAFYRAQLGEIERDVERGLLPADDAGAARAETARRLIAAASQTDAESPANSPLWRRRVAAVLILVFVPALALAVYTQVGAPDAPDAPLSARRADPSSPEGLQLAIAKIEARLASHPDDARGWEVLAPVYMRLGRFDDAVAAYRQLLRLKQPTTAATEAAYGEALLAAAQGTVTGPSREAFEKALKIDPNFAMARFYLALAAEQDGDTAKAKSVYEELEPQAKGEAPWMIGLQARLDALRGGGAGPAPQGGEAQAQASFTPEQQKMIRGMVEGLAQRLAQNGGSAEEWARLIRAYSVLKDQDKAKAALGQARKAFASDATALGNFDALAHELGIGG
jgi:cytochrome c-type biogenesis protein CcmH